jgi:DNA-binding SARP family transcriptional activator/WD40 repeat protein
MRFGVLGRLEVARGDGQPVPVTGPAQRQILAALVARAGSLVTATTLIDDLWGEAAPRSAVGTLRSHVARLRDRLGRDAPVLVSEGDGYRLRVEPDDVDAVRFETLLERAREVDGAPAALECYDAALALWRDEAYLEFGDAPFAVGERIRLAELRALARERRTELAMELGMSAELIGELEQRVRAEPYRERGWEQLALALYRASRQADALAACRRARTLLIDDLGVEPGPALQALEQRLLRQDPDLLISAARPVSAQPVLDRCPYLGLAGYDEQDVALFVGRERLTSVLAGRVADQSVVLVTGASGVGKSSLVRAGLVPALRNGALPGSASWRIDVETPLTAADITDRRRPDLLVLDQAEQLFTGLEPDARERVVRSVMNYVQYGQGRLVVVLRSDFFGRLAEVEQLAALASKSSVLVGPMRADELRRALVEPAAAAGLRLEDELIETVMDDVAGQPEPLPLLSAAMVRTWSRREGDVLTLSGYRRSGGVAGALEAAAEECYARLDETARRAARHVLVRMAAPSGTGGWVRRPLSRADLAASGPEAVALEALVAARLAIVTDQRVELAHDALLERWPRLRDWLDERMLAAELLEHLEQAAIAWRTSGRQDADLYRGARLSAALDWRAEHPADVSADVDAFVDASNRASQAELAAARQQAEREARGRLRLRRVVVALAAVVVLAVAGGVIALYEQASAHSQARRAVHNALTADVSRLATLAGTLPGDQRDVALLLGAEAYQLQPSSETASGLQTALMRTPPGLDRVIRYRSSSLFPHLDQRGRLLAVPGADGSVSIDDVDSGRVLRTLHWPSARQWAVFSGDDRLVAAGGSDGTVAVWDVRTGRRSGDPLRVSDGAVHPVFDPHDDNRVYVISSHGGLSEWDRSDPQRPREVATFGGISAFATPGVAPALTISPDGRTIATGELYAASQSAATIWDTRTRKVLHTFGGAIGVLADDNVTLPFGFGNDTVLLNARTGRPAHTVRGTGNSALSLVSADGARVAVAQQFATSSAVAVYDVATQRRIGQPLTLGSSSVHPLGFLSDGRLVTTSVDAAAVWTVGASLPPLGVSLDTTQDRAGGHPGEWPFFLPRQHDVVVSGNALVRHDPSTGRPEGPLLGGRVSEPLIGSPDGRLIAAVGGGGLGIWSLATGRSLAFVPWRGGPLPVNYLDGLDWSIDGDHLAADIGGVAYVWNLARPGHPSAATRVDVREPGVVDGVNFTPDGQRLVVVTAGPRISSIELATGRVLWSRAVGDAAQINQLAISPDGTIAFDVGGPGEGLVTLLDGATGRPVGSITEPTLGGVGYLNHGQWLIVTSDDPDPQAQLYDASTLTPLGVPFPTADVDQDPLAVDPSGTRFAEPVNFDYNLPMSWNPYLWNADPTSWVKIACAIAGRNLTRSEWRSYLPDLPYRRTCDSWPAGV